MKIVVSFSGGRTSAYMGWWLKHHTDHDLEFVFMNTGCELEETLIFLDEADKRWDLNLHWIEAEINQEKNKGTRYRETTFENAEREGQIFESMIQAYGIPNKGYPHCTRELKKQPFKDYVRVNGLQEYKTAIGIRADEVDRVSVRWKEDNLIYPLITMNPTKESDVNWWWSFQDFDLGINQFEGNCSFCWKKSWKKLATLAIQRPEIFEFTRRMEQQYGYVRPERGKQAFFRDSNETAYIFELAKTVKIFTPNNSRQQDVFWDATGGCSESCEVFS